MKRVGLVAIAVTCLLLVTGCNKKEVLFKEDTKHNNMNDYTYKFIGESNHFYFQTGKVYYEESTQALLISNFKVKGNISNKAKFSIGLYFNDNLLYGSLDTKLTKKELENTVIAESGNVAKIDSKGNQIGESDAFLETKKDTFKVSIKLIVKYCIDKKCEEEPLKIRYLK